ncbi:glutathione peroxidase [Thermolongibacillus altinsuensis]|uniref:glutathione peroxidase n=1 Tax=Thermolongibacillus altinsuensis TaxID=575256 RepID=UPI00242A2FDC|nr:glutathione peroxidase [Thermolongibacillus altinsuensis]GMB09160.1 glutathione peroxidase [Thermolongibacillus altinsuensis]
MRVYDFIVEKANGEPISLEQYKGKVLLIVNTASKCTFTPQFDDLQKLYEKYHDRGFEILGFPCNQFGAQEPGSSEEAVGFCQRNYGVEFPIFAKVDVNGEEAHPLFTYLKKQAPFQGFDETNVNAKLLKLMISDKNPEWLVGDEIKWNFTKFLIDREGNVVKRYEPFVEPSDFAHEVEALL